MGDSNDAALAAEGDYQAFERLYRRYLSRIYSLCARLAGSRERAGELTADVFVKAWAELPNFNGDSSFGTWLHTLATQVVLAEGNENGSDAPSTDEEPETSSEGQPDSGSTFSASTSHDGSRLDVGEAIDRLPADARKILVLHDVEGYRHEQIAEMFGITAGVSKAKLRRARVLLKEALGR
jgi:RNA polymerase sigma-70 factor (ECF subfamily)